MESLLQFIVAASFDQQFSLFIYFTVVGIFATLIVAMLCGTLVVLLKKEQKDGKKD